MDGTAASTADVFAVAIAFGVLGLLLVVFGLVWSGGRSDELVDDPKLPDRFDDDEREYRAIALRRGATGMLVVGGLLIVAGIALALLAP